MGMFQKRRFRNLLDFIQKWKEDDPRTHDGLNVKQSTMRDIFAHFKCDANTIAFAGHALALYLNDDYMDDVKETLSFFERSRLYAYSVSRYGNSPYIYPMWGLGGLPEGL